MTTHPDTVVRRAAVADVEAITRIYNEAIATTTATFDTEARSVDDRLSWFGSHGDRFPVLVAELDGRIAGWGCLSQWSDRAAYAGTGEITYYVAADARRRGIGTALLHGLVRTARELDFHTLIARITAENDVSVRMCTDFGFVRVGTLREVGNKFGRLLDVDILQKMLR